MPQLLVVDDEPGICWGLGELGREMGWEVVVAATAEEGLATARRRPPDVMMLDVRLPGMDGLAALAQFRKFAAGVPVILMTAHGSLETAVRAAQTDAIEYLLKPFDLQTARAALQRAWQSGGPVAFPAGESPAEPSAPGFAGNSPAMQAVYRRIALAAMSDIPVLLTGESGTGKELAAREIHRHSQRAGCPFVPIHLAALNPALAESELFGHVRGAFTGADQNRNGLLVQAAGGTLFLDEVADIPLPIQIKLLRAVEQGEILPVGSSIPVPVSFRIISASHRDLVEAIEAGQFRHDLYFRLAGFRIAMPGLRSRPEDITLLARHFLELARRGSATVPDGFSEAAMEELQARSWPGNVRELRSAVEHAILLARGGTIGPQHLPDASAAAAPRPARTAGAEQSLKSAVREWLLEHPSPENSAGKLHAELLAAVEEPLFRFALARSRGQIAAAARMTGLHRSTFRRRMEELGIDQDDCL